MDVGKLKHKLRQLKKVEDKIRFEYAGGRVSKKYVWDEYFSTKLIDDMTVKYPISKLLNLHKQELKEIFEEYFYSVYFQKYKDIGLDFDEIQDPSVLDYFGLTPGASIDDIKKKFRELAKKYHPDHGGSSEKMIEVLDTYHKLMNKD
ncbi:J domain-containing protein [Tissierella carlieri]|uniref:J domain-containing protein n=1 Tax=Tissierella carlieri TaxID=689904 RepID=UPI0023EEC43B|nr:J domain-containing protein [Tissierella carlieri]